MTTLVRTRNDLSSLRHEREEEAHVIAGLDKQISDLMEEINALNTKQAAIQDDIRETKRHTTETADVVAQLSFQVETTAQDCNVLRSQIVSSPERLKSQIIEKNDDLTKEKG